MQKFTKAEIEWIIGELNKSAEKLKMQATKEENAGIAAGFMGLRAEQFTCIGDKLQKVITEENKRIEVTY